MNERFKLKCKHWLFPAIVAFASLQPQTKAAVTVDLGGAGSFSVLAGAGASSSGSTRLYGNLGTYPTVSITGFSTIDAGPGIVFGTTHQADAVALAAQGALTTAYDDAAGRTVTSTVATQLGATTRMPGVYNSADGTFQITGTLTLDAQGDPNAVFIFKMATTLVTATGSQVVLIGGAQAANVFWQVGSSATIGTDAAFSGNILANATSP